MKLEDLIKELEKIKEKDGNLEVYYSEYDEWEEIQYYALDTDNMPYVTTIGICDEKDTINRTYKTVVLI